MAGPRKVRLPAEVLERARQAMKAPRPPPAPKLHGASVHPREKIVQALKKLHPMD